MDFFTLYVQLRLRFKSWIQSSLLSWLHYCIFVPKSSLEKINCARPPIKIGRLWVSKWSRNFTMGLIDFWTVDTTSWGCWKHHFGIPGVTPIFLKPKLHKKSKNGFKTINYRPYRIVIFSNYFFRYQKSSKKLDGFTSN